MYAYMIPVSLPCTVPILIIYMPSRLILWLYIHDPVATINMWACFLFVSSHVRFIPLYLPMYARMWFQLQLCLPSSACLVLLRMYIYAYPLLACLYIVSVFIYVHGFNHGSDMHCSKSSSGYIHVGLFLDLIIHIYPYLVLVLPIHMYMCET